MKNSEKNLNTIRYICWYAIRLAGIRGEASARVSLALTQILKPERLKDFEEAAAREARDNSKR